jgi:hypothetical protein
MSTETGRDIPETHPIRNLFHQLTERGMGQLNSHDPDIIRYLTNLLTEFVHSEKTFRIQDTLDHRQEDLLTALAQAGAAISVPVRRDCYRQLGDLALFNLGLFPENLTYGHRLVSLNYYADAGRRSYTIVAEMATSPAATALYRKLSEQFQQCVRGLNWVKSYINDPFYQYMFREFGVNEERYH